MADIIRIGTRPSPLALKQVEEVQAHLPGVKTEAVIIKTQGDKNKTTALSGREDSDFFTREIEEALLRGEIDAAVHSAKDLESNMPEGLVIAALTRSISPFECLVSRGNLSLAELPEGAAVGTSSYKRKEALRRFRSDLIAIDIRGNIDERLRLLDSGRYDAIIVAHAALIRLKYENRIAEIISPAVIEPHPLQGALAIQVRSEDAALIRLFSALDTRKEEKDENKDKWQRTDDRRALSVN